MTVAPYIPIIVFPNVHANEMFKQVSDAGAKYFRAFCVADSPTAKNLVFSLARGIETQKRFIGTNFYGYAEGARRHYPPLRNVSDEQMLQTFLELTKELFVWGVVLPTPRSVTLEEVLIGKHKIEPFLRNGGSDFDKTQVERLIFVPSPKYTIQFWGFHYYKPDLEALFDAR